MYDLIISYTDKNRNFLEAVYYEYLDVVMLINYTDNKINVLNNSNLNVLQEVIDIIKNDFEYIEYVGDNYKDSIINEMITAGETQTELYKAIIECEQ